MINVYTINTQLSCLPKQSLKSYFSLFLLTGDSLKKKNDDAPSEHRSFKAHLATLTLDFLVIIVPMLLFFTVSVLGCIKYFANT